MMTRGRKKGNGKKKDLVREVNKESEEKWRGLENKVWTVAEFGFYIVLIAFTIFAVGYKSPSLTNKGNNYIVDPNSKNVEEGNRTVYYKVANECSDLRNCTIEEVVNYSGCKVNVYYNVEKGVGTLKINSLELTVGALSEFAILENGYVATFTNGNDGNIISYYNPEGTLIRGFNTELSATGKLDSDVGVYAVCNNGRMDTVKYTITSDGNFFEELIGTNNSEQC